MKINEKIKNISFAQIVLYISLFFVGIFYEYLSCVLSVVILVWLTVKLFKKGSINIEVSVTFAVVAFMVLSYAVVSLWAVDSGVALFGFFKFLPVLLYSIVLMQEEGGRERVINGLPYVVTVMTVISVILMYLPFFSEYFKVSDRLSGFFQYPNTFALVLLVAELLLLTRERNIIADYICMVILVFGIFYTGSRTVLVLWAISNICAVLINKNKKVKWITLACIGGGAIAVVIYCFITDNFWVLERYLKISFTESTFVGRLLYAKDALPTVLSHPFGIGFKGYYYIQQSIQTGAYSVMYIHNDFLQFILDIGWIPGLAFIFAMVRSLFVRNASIQKKLVLCVMLLHSLFDFNLQYIAVFMMLLLFVDTTPVKTITISQRKVLFTLSSSAAFLLCSYMAVALGLSRFGLYRAGEKVCPFNTECKIELMKGCEDISELERLADSIIEDNEYVSVAYSAKSLAAYSRGDFSRVMEYKNKAIELAPFADAEYRDYAYMLINGIALYKNAGDDYSAEYCKSELIALEERLIAARGRLSKLGSGIDTQPNLTFPEEIMEYIDGLEADS